MFTDRNRQVAALLIAICLIGGGGVAYGLPNLLVQLTALIILALNGQPVARFVKAAPLPLVGLTIATLALPLIQLVPLPQSLFGSLPGRDLAMEAFRAANYTGWSSFSLDHARTLVAFAGLIAPVTLLVTGFAIPARQLGSLSLIVIAAGLVNVALGVVQVLGSSGLSTFYPELAMPDVLFGTFANRNSTGLFLVCCLVLLATLPPARPASMAWLAKAAAAVLLATGVVLTQSRTSIVLMAIPTVLAIVVFVLRKVRDRAGGTSQTNKALQAMLAATAIAIVALPLAGGSRIETSLARFEKADEQRPKMWEDARFAAQRYWPVGAGMGTFDEVFQVDETLEYVSPRRAGRAHNDYIEIAVEAGAVGLGLCALWALWVLWASWRAIATPARWQALSGTGILLAIALQSTLDYPLRNQTMLGVAALAILLLARARESVEGTRGVAGAVPSAGERA